MSKPKLVRITTVPVSLKKLLEGQPRFMKESGFDVLGVSSSGKELQEVAADEGVRVLAVEMTRLITPLSDLRSLIKLYRVFVAERPQIVHSHTPKAGILAMVAAWLARVPVRLHTVAGMPLMESSGSKRFVLEIVEKLTYLFASKVYPNSRGLYDFIVQSQLINPKKLKVLASGSSNGIDTKYFHADEIKVEQRAQLRSHLGIAEDDFVFVFVGRLVGDKGINELVAAFKAIQESKSVKTTQQSWWFKGQVKLLLVGSFEAELDPLKAETLAEIESNAAISYAGYQNDVRPYYAISDCLTFPSYREGFPNVVMQAGAMGLPSIVSDINGCNEIVIHGQNGAIVPAKNTDRLMNAMLNMLEDKKYFGILKQHARELITSRYSQQVVWSALLAEYKLLIQQQKK